MAGVATAAVITGVAIADAGNPPSSGYVALSPTHNVLTGTAIGANASNSPVAIGGATTVPTNATAVRIMVTVKDAKSGQLQIYPAGDPTAGGATAVSFTGGTTATTATVQETVGLKSEITFHNNSAGVAIVTVTLTGYSTQITATNIAPDGGSTGQVLTNSGNGVSWQDLPKVKAYAQSSSELSGGEILSASSDTTAASVSVPAGSYLVTFTALGSNSSDSSPDHFLCHLVAPSGNNVSTFYGVNDLAVEDSTMSDDVLMSTTTGGTIAAKCRDSTGHEVVAYPGLIATQMGSVSGYVGS